MLSSENESESSDYSELGGYCPPLENDLVNMTVEGIAALDPFRSYIQ